MRGSVGNSDSGSLTLTAEARQSSVPKSTRCPICLGEQFLNIRKLVVYQVVRCSGCGVEFLDPQPGPDVLKAIYSADYFWGVQQGLSESDLLQQKSKTGEMYARKLIAMRKGETGALLEIGCGNGEFLAVAQKLGFEVHGIEVSETAAAIANQGIESPAVECADIGKVKLPIARFDVAFLSDVIEHVRDPRDLVRRIHDSLRPGGLVFLATPVTDSWSHRLMGKRWMEYKVEHLFYFNRRSLTVLLGEEGFDEITFGPHYKFLSLEYIRGHFRRYPVVFWSALINKLGGLLPRNISEKMFPISASGAVVTARKK